MNPQSKNTSIRQANARRGGWNLIELLVVISIITILLAILINSAAEGKGPEALTKVTMRSAMGAATEYEVSTSQVIDGNSPAQLPGPPVNSAPSSMQRFLYKLWALDRTRNMLQSLDKEALQGGTSGPPPIAPTDLKDGWGNKMRYYGGSGGKVIIDGGTQMDLGPAGMPLFKGPYIASPGADGKWGTYNTTTNLPNNDGAADNLFSFNLD